MNGRGTMPHNKRWTVRGQDGGPSLLLLTPQIKWCWLDVMVRMDDGTGVIIEG